MNHYKLTILWFNGIKSSITISEAGKSIAIKTIESFIGPPGTTHSLGKVISCVEQYK